MAAASSLPAPASAVASSSRYSLDLPTTDALPYFDTEIDTQPQLRNRVEREIQAELAKMTKDTADARLPPASLQPFSDVPHLAQEMQRLGELGQKTSALDTARFKLPAPPGGLDASEEEWDRAINNAAVQLTYQEGRMTNIELLKRFGANSWRLHNYQQEHFVKQYQQAKEKLDAQTAALNRRRHQDQTEAGKRLAALERKWTELISRGLQLEVANITAEHEIQALELEEARLTQELAGMEA
ncbi:unnamed protein product [Parajaminaea phylloscopi]